jgi:hypothetical protein
LPEHSGYAFRSHSILRELAAKGVEIAALTGPKQGKDAELEIDGVRYLRTPPAAGASTSGVRGQLYTVRATRTQAAHYLDQHATQVIHAHSPCLNGLAALRLRKPVLYEMRSSWEDAAVSVGTTTEGSLRYRVSRWLETFVVKQADEIAVICEGLRKELIGRGLPEQKITVVPNALPAEMFDLPGAEQRAEIRARYGLETAAVIGFFGSFFEWEGIELLIDVMPEVLASAPQACLLLAGGGQQEARLHELVREKGLERKVIFAGRIPHEEVRAYYSAADVMAYPRVPDRLTDMVTPLKPLEAMAQGTVVVASDVGGHRELIEDGQTGFLFAAGDRAALARTLVEVLAARADMSALTARARQMVERERRWSVVAERYLPIYERLAAASL